MEVEIYLALLCIVIVFVVLNMWLLWYWALLSAIVLVIGGVLIITDGMLD